jgi:hypothetical protein
MLFARLFGVTIPQRIRRVRVKGGCHVERNLFYIPSRNHFKELGAIQGEVHNIQAGEFMTDDIEANYCYIADGANSLQQDIMAHLFSRRNRQTGRLESMALAVDACTDKMATGQHR